MFKTYTEYNNYLTNLNCCISKKAVEVSKLFSIGDKCAEQKSNELFLLTSYAEILCNYKPKLTSGLEVTEAIGCLSEDSYKKIIKNINSLCEFCNCEQ